MTPDIAPEILEPERAALHYGLAGLRSRSHQNNWKRTSQRGHL